MIYDDIIKLQINNHHTERGKKIADLTAIVVTI